MRKRRVFPHLNRCSNQCVSRAIFFAERPNCATFRMFYSREMMNRSRLWQASQFFIFAAILLPGCGGESKQSGLVVVNVLDKVLYEDCHITGSINIELDCLEKEFSTIEKDAEIVLYCSNFQCSTSEYVAKQLRKQGFEHVSVYEGGTAEWYQAGLPVEGPHEQAYLSKPLRHIDDGEQSDISVIAMHELAQKMNVISKDNMAA